MNARATHCHCQATHIHISTCTLGLTDAQRITTSAQTHALTSEHHQQQPAKPHPTTIGSHNELKATAPTPFATDTRHTNHRNHHKHICLNLEQTPNESPVQPKKQCHTNTDPALCRRTANHQKWRKPRRPRAISVALWSYPFALTCLLLFLTKD